MPYTKTEWTETTGITPARLINIEDGIGEAHWYGATTNSGNAYSVTLNPAPSAYYAGMRITIKVNAANTGSATINCNGLGARAINKPNGNNLFAGNFKADSVYTLIYNGTSFFLQGSDSTGNATASNVLAGKTFSNDINTDLVGTMPNRAGDTVALSATTSGTTLKLRASNGYRDGVDDYVTHTDVNRIAGNIKKDVVLDGITGEYNDIQFTAGDNIQVSSDAVESTPSQTYTMIKTLSIGNTGTYRVSFALSLYNADFGTGYAKIYNNGSPRGIERTSTNRLSPTTFTQDLLLNAGTVEIFGHGSASPGGATMREFRIKTAQARLFTQPTP